MEGSEGNTGMGGIGHAPRAGQWKALTLIVIITLAVGGLGGLATMSSVTSWYPTLNKPGFTPPNAVFGPAWSLLYVLMAISAWRVWRRPGPGNARRTALGLWSLQLALNFAWSFLFFGLRAPAVALAEILVLVVALAATLVASWRVDRIAGLLLAPYLAWVGFATLLTFEIWRLN